MIIISWSLKIIFLVERMEEEKVAVVEHNPDLDIKITLVASDGVEVGVSYGALCASEVLKNMCDETGVLEGLTANPASKAYNIPVSNSTGPILTLIVSYMERYHDRPEQPEPEQGAGGAKPAPEMDEWEREFIKLAGMEQNKRAIFDVLLVSNYLKLRKLVAISAYTIACRLKGKTPEAIRAEFGVEDDLSSEEKAQLEKEDRFIQDKDGKK